MHHCFWKNVAVNCNIFKIISNNLSWLTQNYGLPLVIRNLGQPTFKKKSINTCWHCMDMHEQILHVCLHLINSLVCAQWCVLMCVFTQGNTMKYVWPLRSVLRTLGEVILFQHKGWWNKHEGLPQGRLRQQHLFYRHTHKHEYSYRHTKTRKPTYETPTSTAHNATHQYL